MSDFPYNWHISQWARIDKPSLQLCIHLFGCQLYVEGWSSYARPLCLKLPSVPIERAGIVGGHLVLVNFSWALWRHRWLLLLLLPLCQVTSSSLLVSTTRRRVCMIDTILRRGSIPDIGQYLRKDYNRDTNILFQLKYFENQIVFSYGSTFMLLEMVGTTRANFAEFTVSVGRWQAILSVFVSDNQLQQDKLSLTSLLKQGCHVGIQFPPTAWNFVG